MGDEPCADQTWLPKSAGCLRMIAQTRDASVVTLDQHRRVLGTERLPFLAPCRVVTETTEWARRHSDTSHRRARHLAGHNGND